MIDGYRDNDTTTLLTRIRTGDYPLVVEEWSAAVKIKDRYGQRLVLHNCFITSLLTGVVLAAIILVGLFVKRYNGRQGKSS